jgi:uncharacterized protein (TIGR00661 family)
MAEMVNDTLAKANSQGKAPISIPANSPPKKIVMGICGIGNGHMNRQIPVLKHLLDVGHEVIVLVSEGRSHEILDRFSGYPNLKVMDTANPYFVGGEAGLDFLATAEAQKNSVQFLQVNARVLHEITSFFGRADLVISDYELVSAQYAYAKGASLVTLDQQSKYLRGSFPPNLNGSTYQDEVERLRMFFPLATKRFALSFFNVDQADAKVIDGEVSLHAPIIRTALIERINQEKSSKPSLVVYMSDQHAADSGLESWSTVLSTQPEIDVHVFLPRRLRKPENYANLHFYFHGDQSFDDLLAAAHGVVATAGHSLLSEAMFLEIPVLALPLPLYEQQMNAHIIDAHGFGLSSDKLTSTSLDEFVRHLDMYTNNIRRDQRVLLRPNAEPSLFGEIDNLLK